nr:MAG TPA: Protein translocase subunit SecY, Protein, membrane protein, PROTEIN TRANSPORT-IMMUNE [Caudoviricetes sp.]
MSNMKNVEIILSVVEIIFSIVIIVAILKMRKR